MATYTTTRKKIRSEANSQVYTGPHKGLAGLDDLNCHPMKSITGLEAELASIQSHIGDVGIHYAMNQISITESQISDLQAYLPLAGGTVEFLDVTNNLTVGTGTTLNGSDSNPDVLTITHPSIRNASGADGLAIVGSVIQRLQFLNTIYNDKIGSIELINYNDGGTGWYNIGSRYRAGYRIKTLHERNEIVAVDIENTGNLIARRDLKVDNNLTVGGDTILSDLAGGGTRTLKIDNNGKLFAE